MKYFHLTLRKLSFNRLIFPSLPTMFAPKLMWILFSMKFKRNFFEEGPLSHSKVNFYTVYCTIIFHCGISLLKKIQITQVKCIFNFTLCFQGGWIYYLSYRLKKSDDLIRISIHLESFHIFLFYAFIHLFVPQIFIDYLLYAGYTAGNNVSIHHTLMFLIVLYQVLWIT